MRVMYTVLIADDETIVRMMLSSMIDWEEMELKLAGTKHHSYNCLIISD